MTTGYRATKLGIDNSLTEAGLDYFDLMLIHWPMQDDLGTYRALEEAYQAGKLRSIGVSNFNRAQLGEITANFQTVPVLKDLAAKYDHTTAQVMLRYLTQRQIMVIPRSTNPAHMAANLNIFDFALLNLTPWQDLHPNLVTVPLDTPLTVNYGVLASRQAPQPVQDFMNRLRQLI